MLGSSPSSPSSPSSSRLRRAAIPLALTLVLTSVLALGAACGAESSGANAFSSADSGSAFDSGAGLRDASLDTGVAPFEAGADASAGPAHAVFVQGSRSLGDVRLCWGPGGLIDPILPFPSAGAMPGSNYPGIPQGGTATFEGDAGLPIGLTTFYAIPAKLLANMAELTCDQLVCPPSAPQLETCLTQYDEYWPIAPTSGVLPGPNVIGIVGCESNGQGQDPTATTARCGADWTADAGNLRLDVARLNGPTTMSSPDGGDGGDAGFTGQLVLQATLLSPAANLVLTSSDAGLPGPELAVSFGPEVADAGDGGDAGSPVFELAGEGVLGFPRTIQIGPSLAAFGQLGFSIGTTGAPALTEWMSLAQMQELVDPTEDPTIYFGQPRTYLLAVVGDPYATHADSTSGDAGYDGTGLHLLLIPGPQ